MCSRPASGSADVVDEWITVNQKLGQCRWIAVSSFPQPLQPAETETDPNRPKCPACHLLARGPLAGRDRGISFPGAAAAIWPKPPLHPKQPDPKFSRRLSVANSTKSLKTFCCQLSAWNPNPSTTTTNPTPRDSRSVRLGNHSTQSIPSGLFFPFLSPLQSQWPPHRHPPARPRSMPSSRRLPPAPLASSADSSSTPDSPLPVPSAAR